jgi:uncharacterized protein (DUF1697 family)
MATFIALLRGINVGKAKRIAMPDLCETLESLRYTQVTTLLASGNAVFESPQPDLRIVKISMETAIKHDFGFDVPTVVLSASELDAIVTANALWRPAYDPSRFLVAFPSDPALLSGAQQIAAKALIWGGWWKAWTITS